MSDLPLISTMAISEAMARARANWGLGGSESTQSRNGSFDNDQDVSARHSGAARFATRRERKAGGERALWPYSSCFIVGLAMMMTVVMAVTVTVMAARPS